MVLISAGKLYLHQIAQEIVFSPVDNLHEKKNKTKQNKARARILNFYLVYNFALVLHEKCLVSSQLEACRFFISIICRVFSRVFETIF